MFDFGAQSQHSGRVLRENIMVYIPCLVNCTKKVIEF